jgi:hypothetical protein
MYKYGKNMDFRFQISNADRDTLSIELLFEMIGMETASLYKHNISARITNRISKA